MVNVTAATSFFGTSVEGMWPAGDTKRVSAHRANELIEAGLAIEARDQGEEAVTAPATAASTGFAVPVTLESMKEEKPKGKTKEEKAKPETKDEK
jgi:hypothetical protein